MKKEKKSGMKRTGMKKDTAVFALSENLKSILFLCEETHLLTPPHISIYVFFTDNDSYKLITFVSRIHTHHLLTLAHSTLSLCV
jgi:hypothetical protein